jgi:DNA-binding MarR family transcriptional regulator
MVSLDPPPAELRMAGIEGIERLTAARLPEASAPLAALWAMATRAGRLLETFTREIVAREGLDVSEFTILGALWFQDSPHRSTLSQLAAVVALSQPGVSRAVQRALRNGNLIRVVDETLDGRTVVVELTAAGHDRVDRSIRELLRRLEARLAPIDDGTARELAASSRRVALALRP